MDIKNCRSVFLVFCFLITCYQKSSASLELENRVTFLEKLLGHLLTGRRDGSLTNVTEADLRAKHEMLGSHPPSVFFTVYFNNHISGVSDNFIIKFNSVISNIGGHYHTSNGIFIAPVTGMYLFHWQFITGDNLNGYTELVVDGSRKGKSYSDSRVYDTTSNVVILRVIKEQHVWIQTDTSNMNIYYWSSFSGYLITTM